MQVMLVEVVEVNQIYHQHDQQQPQINPPYHHQVNPNAVMAAVPVVNQHQHSENERSFNSLNNNKN